MHLSPEPKKTKVVIFYCWGLFVVWALIFIGRLAVERLGAP